MFRQPDKLGSWYALTWVVVLLLLVVAAAGLWGFGVYDGLMSPAARAATRGTDLACMGVVPLLLLVSGRAMAGSVAGAVLWIGLLLFAAHVEAGYALGGVFNGYYLVYLAALGAALFAAAGLLANVAPRAAARSLRRAALERFIGAYFIVAVVALAPAALTTLAEGIGARQAPDGAAGMAIELGMLLPLLLLSSVWMARDEAWGYVWGAVTLVWLTVLCWARLSGAVFATVEGYRPGSWSLLLYGLGAVVGALLSWAWLGNSRVSRGPVLGPGAGGSA